MAISSAQGSQNVVRPEIQGKEMPATAEAYPKMPPAIQLQSEERAAAEKHFRASGASLGDHSRLDRGLIAVASHKSGPAQAEQLGGRESQNSSAHASRATFEDNYRSTGVPTAIRKFIGKTPHYQNLGDRASSFSN